MSEGVASNLKNFLENTICHEEKRLKVCSLVLDKKHY